MTDEQLRNAYERALDRRTGDRTRRHACPDPDALLALAQRRGSDTERLALLDHVGSCVDCARELELLRAIVRAERREQPPRVQPWRGVSIALAAGLVLAVVFGPVRERLRRRPDTFRGGAAEVGVIGPANDTVVGNSAVTFSWRSVAGANRYTLEVVDQAGDVARSVVSSDTAAILPAASLAAGDYKWWVRARTPGSELRSVARGIRVRIQ